MRQIVEEKGLSYESVLTAIESALAAAYRKDFGHRLQNIEAKFSPEDGSVKLWDVKTVVEDREMTEEEKRGLNIAPQPFGAPDPLEVAERRRAKALREGLPVEEETAFNPKTQIMLSDARVLKMGAKIGDVLRRDLEVPGSFGRMAAMTAKQVILQKLREAERGVVYTTYKEQEGSMLTGTIQRREGRNILVELGKGIGVLRPEDQVQGERYFPNDRIRALLRSVELGQRGPDVLLTRSTPEFVQALFASEIPEIADGSVRVEGVAREPGSRSKVSVSTNDDRLDPVGACIGQRGARIQTIIAELSGEKIDMIEWDEDPGVYVMNALEPAQVITVALDEEQRLAQVTVKDDQLSVAIGRGGQNVRLASKLTGWVIRIATESGEVRGSSEGAVEGGRSAHVPTPEQAQADEEKVEAIVEQEIVAAETAEHLAIAQANADGDDNLADAEDESTEEAEEAEQGLESDALPSALAEEADKKDGDA